MTLRRNHPVTDPTDDQPRYGAYATDDAVVVYDEHEPTAWIESDAAVPAEAMA